jgi:hypothetical protein
LLLLLLQTGTLQVLLETMLEGIWLYAYLLLLLLLLLLLVLLQTGALQALLETVLACSSVMRLWLLPAGCGMVCLKALGSCSPAAASLLLLLL